MMGRLARGETSGAELGGLQKRRVRNGLNRTLSFWPALFRTPWLRARAPALAGIVFAPGLDSFLGWTGFACDRTLSQVRDFKVLCGRPCDGRRMV